MNIRNHSIFHILVLNKNKLLKLIKELCYNKPPVGRFNIFAVEGATAAMCYIFDSLIANELLVPGDKIALMVPVFTPYLEIPHLPRYNFKVVHISAI